MPTTPGRRRPAAAAAAGTAAALLGPCAVPSTSVREDDTPESVTTAVPDTPVTLRPARTDDPPGPAQDHPGARWPFLPFPDPATPGMADRPTPGIRGPVSAATSQEGSLAASEVGSLRTLQQEWGDHHE